MNEGIAHAPSSLTRQAPAIGQTLVIMVGTEGFKPSTYRTQTDRAIRLRYAPKTLVFLITLRTRRQDVAEKKALRLVRQLQVTLMTMSGFPTQESPTRRSDVS